MKEKEEEDDRRIGRKLVGGVLGGVGGGLAGAAIMLWGDRGDFGDTLPALLGFWGGNLVGTPVGVSAVDPQDNFLITLVGSALAGVGVPAAILFMTANDENDSDAIFILSGLLGPIVGSTIASEVWRKPLSAKPHLKPEAFRISVGLVQDLKGGLSAIARLRF